MIVDSLKKIPNGWIICFDYPACLLIVGVFINWLEDGRRETEETSISEFNKSFKV